MSQTVVFMLQAVEFMSQAVEFMSQAVEPGHLGKTRYHLVHPQSSIFTLSFLLSRLGAEHMANCRLSTPHAMSSDMQ